MSGGKDIHTMVPNPVRGLWAYRMAPTTLLLAVLLTVMPLVAQASPERAQIVTTWPTQEKLVALTFDAGSDVGIADEILDILGDYGVHATFFLTGRWLELNPSAARRIADEGHSLGNHSYTHPDFREISEERMRAEIADTERLAQEVLGATLRPFFRPPYGAYNARVLEIVADEGYSYSVMWTVDSLDWKGISAEEMFNRIADNLRPGAVVLLHVGSGTKTAEALPLMLDLFIEEGYRQVTLPELMASTGDQKVYTVQSGDTLFGIAGQFNVTVDELLASNDLDDTALRVGQMLLIPGVPGDPGPQDPEPSEPEVDEPEPGEEEEEEEEEPPLAGEGGAGEEEIDSPAGSWWEVLLRIVRMLWATLRDLVLRLLP